MIRRFPPAVQACVRAANAGCWLVEVITAHGAALLSVPDTPENRERRLEHAPLITGDMLDNTSHRSTTSIELADLTSTS